MKIKYPYIPADKKIKYVSSSNKFMRNARRKGEVSGCRKQPTGAVIVQAGRVVAEGSNSGIKVDICPRVLRASKTGTDYHFCQDLCRQAGHAEVVAVEDAREKQIDTKGADLYLWGHWWCCEPCWGAMIKAGIKNVYLEKGSEENPTSSRKAYISGALTRVGSRKNYRKIYEMIAMICSDANICVYLPHIFNDPILAPEISARTVWKRDHQQVSSSDLIIAYVGQPSLGVGAELEIARMSCKDILIWYFTDEKVSRMALGNPNIKKTIIAENEKDLYKKIIRLF